MKKIISRILCVAMMVSLSASLIGCSGESPAVINKSENNDIIEDENKDSDIVEDEEKEINIVEDEEKEIDIIEVEEKEIDIVGKWTTTMDLLEMDPSMSGYFDKGDCVIEMVMNFNADGTYNFTIDEDSLKNAVAVMIDVMAESMDVSAEELAEMSGMSLDELIEESMASMSTDEMMMAGNYILDSDKLYITEDLDVKVDDFSEVLDVKLSENKLELTDEYNETLKFERKDSAITDDEKTESGIVGEWIAEMDCIEMDPSMAEYFDEGECVIEMIMKFSEDGTYKFTPDKDSTKDAVKSMIDVMAKSMDMSAEELAEISGMSLDELIEDGVATIGNDEMSGNYILDDNKLYTSHDLDEEIEIMDDSWALDVELNGNEMELSSKDGITMKCKRK